MAAGGIIALPELAVTPSVPSPGNLLFYTKTDGNAYILNSSGVESVIGSVAAITDLTGDVSATGPGSVSATVNFVGGQAAATIAASVIEVGAASSTNVASTIVKRDGAGNFSAGTITATLNGNASTATSAVSAINFSGSLAGDVTGIQGATVVSFVGGESASNIASATAEVLAAASINTPGTLVLRDGTGSFVAGTIIATFTGNLTGNVTGNVSGSAASFTGSLGGDVTGTQFATTVQKIQGSAVSSTPPTDAQILVYNNSSSTWVPVSMSGDVALTHTGSTSISSTTITGKLLTGYVVGSNTAIAATDSILSAFEKVQGQLNSTMSSAITALTGDGTATGPGSVPFTLATVNSNVGSFGSQTQVASLTVNGKGLITAASNVTIGNLTNSNLSGSAGITGANIASSTISNTNLAQMAANTVKANTSGIPANPVDTLLGTVTEATSSVLTLTGWTDATIGSPTIQVLQATTSESGYLSSTDWNTFNNKQAAGNYITALTGDVTATGPGSAAATISSTTITGKLLTGLTTGTNTPIVAADSILVGFENLQAQISSSVGAAITSLTGDVSATGPGAASSTVNSVGGQTSTSVAFAATQVAAATSADTPSTLVLRDGSGNFSAGVVTASLIGNVTGNVSGSAASFTGSLSGDVTGTQSATNVAKIQGTAVSGTTGTGNVVFSANPSFTGNIGAVNLTLSGTLAITDSSTSALVINTNAFIVDSTNNAIGIGTQPATNVMIDGVNTSAASKLVQMTGYGVGSTTGYRGRFARGTSGTPAAAQTGDVLSAISGRGYGASQFATASTGVINIVAGETFTNTSNMTYLQFSTTPTGSVTSAEAMRIATTGVTLGPQSAGTAIHASVGGWIRTTKTITSSYTVDTTTTDDIILVNFSAPGTITLPAATVGRTIVIKDISGNAQTNTITVAPAVGTTNIEGLNANKPLNTNYGSWTFSVGSAGNWWMI